MLLLVDLDGVVYRGLDPVPGMPQLLSRRVAAGDRVIYVTNNSRWHRSEYQARLQGMGAPVDDESVLTSARATALAIAHRQPRPRLVMVLGGEGLAREMEDAGLETVQAGDAGLGRAPDVLAVGIDFDLTYERLSASVNAVLGGAWFVATNRDPVYPSEQGIMAGAGSIVAAVAASAGREPDLVVGKPEPGLFRTAAEIAGIPVADAVVIGDGLFSDIKAARAVGARSVLMLTGVTSSDQLSAVPETARPTVVAHDAEELESVLERLEAERPS